MGINDENQIIYMDCKDNQLDYYIWIKIECKATENMWILKRLQ